MAEAKTLLLAMEESLETAIEFERFHHVYDLSQTTSRPSIVGTSRTLIGVAGRSTAVSGR